MLKLEFVITKKTKEELEFALSVVALVFSYPTIILTWKRLQDFNVHGIFSLLLLVPIKYFSMIFIIVIALTKGNEGINNFDLKKK